MCSLAVLSARLALLCTLFSNLQVVRAGYRFEILLVRYWNPMHYLIDSQTCCEFQFCNECENAFRFCVYERGTDRTCDQDNDSPCSIGKIETKHIYDNNDDIEFTTGGPVGSTLTNPLSVTGESWPREVDICWSVHDLDSSQSINSNSDPVSALIIQVPPLEPGNLTEVLQFDNAHNHIRLQFRLVCEDIDSVSDCSGPCVPTDNATGHFSCNASTGERVCLEGYTDPWSRCTMCVPSAGCSLDNGYCVFGGECRCRANYTGENCTDCLPSANCSVVGGYCEQPLECLCKEGYSGEDCSVCDASVGTCEVAGSLDVSSNSLVSTPSPSSTPFTEEPTVSLSEPFFKKSALMLSVVGNCIVVLIVLATIVVVVLVVIGRRQARRRALARVNYDVAVDSVKIKINKRNHKQDNNDHVYETLDIYSPSPTSRYGISALGPTYAAANAMFKVAQDGEENMDVEENAAYDTAHQPQKEVDMSKNIAYAALERKQNLRVNSRRNMPLPNPP